LCLSLVTSPYLGLRAIPNPSTPRCYRGHRAQSLTLLPVSARAYRGLSPISGRTGRLSIALPSLQDGAGAVGTLLTRRRPSGWHHPLWEYIPRSSGQHLQSVQHQLAERGANLPPGLLGLPWYQSKSLVGLSHTWMDGHILPTGVPVIPVSDRNRWGSRKRGPQAPAAAKPTTGPGSYPDGPTMASGLWRCQSPRTHASWLLPRNAGHCTPGGPPC
jgi:hypothetical protein